MSKINISLSKTFKSVTILAKGSCHCQLPFFRRNDLTITLAPCSHCNIPHCSRGVPLLPALCAPARMEARRLKIGIKHRAGVAIAWFNAACLLLWRWCLEETWAVPQPFLDDFVGGYIFLWNDTCFFKERGFVCQNASEACANLPVNPSAHIHADTATHNTLHSPLAIRAPSRLQPHTWRESLNSFRHPQRTEKWLWWVDCGWMPVPTTAPLSLSLLWWDSGEKIQ